MFSHGQLYVALPRVTNRNILKMLACDTDGKPLDTTLNVLYLEVFRNLM